jgi:hypothetical protein
MTRIRFLKLVLIMVEVYIVGVWEWGPVFVRSESVLHEFDMGPKVEFLLIMASPPDFNGSNLP